MYDGEALLAAIKANPDDDTVRLAYADWLTENGREERAEFIRVSCQLTMLLTYEVLNGRDEGSQDEIDRLINRHISLQTFLDQSAGLLPKDSQVFWGRGFIKKVQCSWPSWLAHGDRLLQAEWVPEVELTSGPSLHGGGWVIHDLEKMTATHYRWPGVRFKLPRTSPYGDNYAVADMSPSEWNEAVEHEMAMRRIGRNEG